MGDPCSCMALVDSVMEEDRTQNVLRKLGLRKFGWSGPTLERALAFPRWIKMHVHGEEQTKRSSEDQENNKHIVKGFGQLEAGSLNNKHGRPTSVKSL